MHPEILVYLNENLSNVFCLFEIVSTVTFPGLANRASLRYVSVIIHYIMIIQGIIFAAPGF